METKWLEDFVSLAETRSFSRSAQLRHVTQPAFSRRIQSLEAWAGTDLVDRSSYPTRLTPAGETLYAQALETLQALQTTRAMLRGHVAAGQDVIEFAVPHSLAFTFFPAWVSSLREKFGPIKSRLIALNVHDAVMRLVEGNCDLLMAFHHDSQPFQFDADRYEMLSLGQEVLAPYVKPDADGDPLFRLPGQTGHPLPYLGYAPGLPGGGLRSSRQAWPCTWTRFTDRHGRPEGRAGRARHCVFATQCSAQGAAGAQAGECRAFARAGPGDGHGRALVPRAPAGQRQPQHAPGRGAPAQNGIAGTVGFFAANLRALKRSRTIPFAHNLATKWHWLFGRPASTVCIPVYRVFPLQLKARIFHTGRS
jgi:DNA-binding transcriptional LysR family regulator